MRFIQKNGYNLYSLGSRMLLDDNELYKLRRVTSVFNQQTIPNIWTPDRCSHTWTNRNMTLVTCMPYQCLFGGTRSSLTHSYQHRYIHLPNPFKRKQNLRPLDKVPPGYELIYSLSLNGYIVYFYPFIMFGSCITLSAALYECFFYMGSPSNADFSPPAGFMFSDPIHFAIVIPIISILALVTYMFTRRCPVRIYFNEANDTFIAIFATGFPWRIERMEFRSGSVRCLYDENDDSYAVMRTFRGRYVLDGTKRLALFSNAFQYPHYYNIMLGYIKK